MLQIKNLWNGAFFHRFTDGWWFPLIGGIMYPLCLPPFNHEFQPVFFLFPFLSFIALLPLFHAAVHIHLKKAILHSLLWGIAASGAQYYWIGNVVAEGLWLMILLGLALMSLYLGFIYCGIAMLCRVIIRSFPRGYILLVPALWVVVDFCRTLGELSFPWMFIGYAMTPILPIAQLASVTGIYGCTFLVVAGNCIVREIIIKRSITGWGSGIGLLVFIGICSLAGTLRLRGQPWNETKAVSLLQPNLDQMHWGSESLDSSFAIIESLSVEAAKYGPDCIIMPESALLCYLIRHRSTRQRILSLSDSIGISLLVGALHWEKTDDNSFYNYRAYNSLFFLKTGTDEFQMYHKMKLVPFSEALPFEGIIPILSRVNLGEADFKAGKEDVVFECAPRCNAVPLICYEVIYPSFVRRRIGKKGTCLINVTNDGWFGKSTAPFHHAAMVRMRCIENGISLARCANSGISMIVDPHGRIRQKTALYTRTIVFGHLPLQRIATLYSTWGDWFVLLSAISLFFLPAGIVMARIKKNRGDLRTKAFTENTLP